MSIETPPVSESKQPPHVAPVPLGRILSLGIVVRLFIDTGIQIFGPFLSIIAAGLGTSIVVLGALNSLRGLMGLASPAFGALAERVGYRKTMRLVLLLGAAGTLTFGAAPDLWVAAVGISLMGLGVFCFAPILQAYMSAQIPYHKRARGLGTVEYAWALAGIIGLPISGLLMSRYGWRAPFFFLGTGMLGGFFLFRTFPAAYHALPKRNRQTEASVRHELAVRTRAFFRLQESGRSAWSAIFAGTLGVFATANVSIIYGAWLTDTYGLNTTQLGQVAFFLGLAELSAIVMITYRGDRFGKYRTVLLSTTGAALTYTLLPVLDVALWTVMIGLVMVRITFESSMVSNISLLSEQSPTQRAHVLSLFSAAVTLGAAVASLAGPYLYTTWGIPGVSLVSAGAAALAALLVLTRVTERKSRPADSGLPGVSNNLPVQDLSED